MKKNKFLYILILTATAMLRGQVQLTATENYLYTKTCLNGDCSKKTESVTYYDGLARPKQNILLNATPQEKDLVSRIEYDSYGRQSKSYLPLPQQVSQNGAIYTNPDASFYGSEKIYSENKFEDFPRARLTESYPQGTAWADKPNRYIYGTNAANDVKMYVAQTAYLNNIPSTSLVQTVNYPAATLDKVTVTDADLNPSTEYKNGKGQTVMVRKNDGVNNTETYYVYDNYGRLVYVIPPLASASALTTTNIDKLCYQYLYDTKGRQIAKKLPGKGWEYMVYDKADRLILTQDAVMNANNQWLITKYDTFGRVAYTGILMGGDRASRQNDMNNSVVTENRSTTGFTKNGMTVYYTENSFTASMILTVNYYDTYPTGSPASPSQVLGQNVLPQDPQNSAVNTRSLPVASYIKNIEDDNWTKNYTWYDNKGRNIATYSINHLGGYTKTESLLDFAGMVQQTVTRHKRLDADPEKVITQTFEYDSQNRLLVHKHQVDNNPVEILAQNSYNAISQLTNKKVGVTSASTSLQSIDYAYNIRGWMTRINDPSNLNGKLFGYEVKYTDPLNTSASGKYNGNIAEVSWKTTNDGMYRRYNYTYDSLNRLLQGKYSEPYNSVSSNDYFNEMVSYDINGNIKTLKRFSRPSLGTVAEKIDDLVYNYDNSNLSNRLTSISLPAGVTNNASGYNALGYTIEYDYNGNMTSQQDKGISAIQYNFLNLPKVITVPQGNISYTYAADGTKVRKTSAAKTVDYLNGFQYETSQSITTLQFVPTAEGYFDFVKNKYIYSYTDHLGNIRLSYFNNGISAEVLEENNYYPFGLKHEGYNALAGNSSYQYKYNGKELQTETEMLDYGFRQYMPELGRFGVVDPFAETTMQPYSYASNRPINYIDFLGLKGLPPTNSAGYKNDQVWTDGEDWWKRIDGGWKNTKSDETVIDEVTIPHELRAIASNPASIMPTNCIVCYSGAGMTLGNLPPPRSEILLPAHFYDRGIVYMGPSDVAAMLAQDKLAEHVGEQDAQFLMTLASVGFFVTGALGETPPTTPPSSNIWRVGAYKKMQSLEKGLDAHHVGQSALMKRFIANYDHDTAPTILVPAVGHRFRGPNGIVSRSTKGFTNARQVLARDIFELRRVYGDQKIPNAALQELIQANKTMYEGAFIKAKE